MAELGAKRLELVREIVPRVLRIGVLWNAANPANVFVLREAEEAARQPRIMLESHEVRGAGDIAGRFQAMAVRPPDALLVFGDVMLVRHGQEITPFALNFRLPSMFEVSEMVVLGA